MSNQEGLSQFRTIRTNTKATRVVKKVTRVRFICDWIITQFLRKLGRANKGNFVLACVPNDTIGREIIVRGLYEKDILDPLFEQIFAQYYSVFANSIALDVGANIGNHSCYFSKYFDSVISFEPNPGTAMLMRANLLLNNITNVSVQEIGLSDQKRELPFLQDNENLGGSGFKDSQPTGSPKGRYLGVDQGDIVLNRLSIRNKKIALIKLDVEGHEYPALKGLEVTITRNRPIIMFETHTSEGEWGGKAILDYLRSLGICYFYSIEKRRTSSHMFQNSTAWNALTRFYLGCDYLFEEINTLQNRLYYVIVGSPEPLT